MANFRHEYKHEINQSDYITLCARLGAALSADEHAGADGAYDITGLYFDDIRDTALMEKINGVDKRDKFRLRRYGQNTQAIKLEKKSKRGQLCLKQSEFIARADVERLLAGDIDFLLGGPPLYAELYSRMRTGLKPKTLVCYKRRAYTFPAGNVRITLDSELRTSPCAADFLAPQPLTIPAGGNIMLLEVKWDEFLPDFIADIIFIPGRRSDSFSKYAQCRIYG